MATVKDTAEIAAKNAQWANAEADRLEAEVRAARERVAAATKQADRELKEWQRVEADQIRNVGAEIRALQQRVDRALSAKVPSTRPALQIRVLARRFLHRSIGADMSEYQDLENFGNGDPRFGELYGLNGAAAHLLTHFVADQSQAVAVDALETRTWRALIERARFLAGEVEA